MKKNNFFLYLVGLVFFVSGVAGLIYEIVWERLLELYFGVTNLSIVLIVGAYMAGLGLGSLFGGYLSRRIRDHLLVYGFVELGIAAFGLFSPGLIIWIGSLTAGAPYALVFLFSFFILIIPTFLMGMTLPLLAQGLITRVENAGEVIGVLYGINTLGAAMGSVLAGFLLIGWTGLAGTVYVACTLNLLVGLLALFANRSFRTWKLTASEPASPTPRQKDMAPLPDYRAILFISFLVGFLGLGYEMLWIRILTIVNKNTVYGFPAILGVFLTGLALGGYYFGKKADESSDPYRLFWKLEVAVACVSALTIFIYWLALDNPLIEDALRSFFRNAQRPESGYVLVDNQYVFSRRRLLLGLSSFMLPILWLVLPASFFMGAGLPVLDRIAIRNAETAGVRVGAIHLMNILGSVGGALLVSFGFLAWFGTEITLKVLVLLSAVFVLFAPARRNFLVSGDRMQNLSLFAIALFLVILPARGALYQKYFQIGTGDPLPVVEEYSDGVLALAASYLWIKGDEHGSYPSNGSYESIILPCIGASRPERVLIIGLGGGNSAYFLTKVPGIREIVIVELMEGLDDFLARNVPRIGGILGDPRVTYVTDDRRRYLYSNPDEKFDLIFTDPLRNYSAGHDSLYSMEGLSLYRTHLNADGIFCLWQDENHIIPRTMAAVFPEVDSFGFVTLASNSPIRYDLNFMDWLVDQYLEAEESALQQDAARHLNALQILLSFSRDRAKIIQDERDTPILTDLDPKFEYYLFRKPIRFPVRMNVETMDRFVFRIDGCDDACKDALYEKVKK